MMAEQIHRNSPRILELCQAARTASRPSSSTRSSSSQSVSASTKNPAGSSRTAGVDAFVKGDYQRAAEILRPLAERWPGELDALSSFLVAAMYESGLGLPIDPLRACALTLRSSAHFPGDAGATGWLSTLATEMFPLFFRPLASENYRMCELLAAIGFEHGFKEETLALDSDHWVGFALSGELHGIRAKVSFRGLEKSTDVPLLLSPGMRFLPIVHTELDAGPAARRRHFIGIFTWSTARPGEWDLFWSLSEIVGLETISIVPLEAVTTIRAESPTEEHWEAARPMTRVRLNDAGDVEWAILDGRPNPAGGIIESEVDRAAQRERETRDRRRREADKQVDWSLARDPHRLPEFSYVDADGCADLFIHGWSADRMEAIEVSASINALGLSSAPRSFDLAISHPDLRVVAHLFQRPQRSWPFCSDVIIAEQGAAPPEQWRAIGGTITIELHPATRSATIQLIGVEFVSESGARVRHSKPIVLTAPYGMYFG